MKALVKNFLIAFFIGISFTLVAQTSDISGTWKLNLEKSNIGGNFSHLNPIKIVISQNKNTLRIESTKLKPNGEEVIESENFKLDGSETMNTLKNRIKSSKVTIDEPSGAITIKSAIEHERNNKKINFSVTEIYKLSDEGKILTIDSQSSSQLGEYQAILVYDKSE